MFLDTFKTNSMFHSYDTRNKSKLFITRHNTILFEQSITYNGVLIYNKLPSEIKGIKSTTLFKKTLTEFFLEKSFYSVEEFMTENF
jgi:CRISPR/Cas system CMR subunit Cmr6 (Cas7 group RAMP superfamily)